MNRMTSKGLLGMVCLAVATWGCGLAHADALQNPEFESGYMDHWEVSADLLSVGVSTNTTFNRNYSARIHGTYASDNWTTGRIFQTIQAKPGNDIYAQGFVYWAGYTSETAGATGRMTVALDGPFGRKSTVWAETNEMWTFFALTGALAGVSEGGFESGTLAGWEPNVEALAAVVTTNRKYEGDCSLRIYGSWNGWGFNHVNQSIEAEVGDVLVAKGYVNVEELTAEGEDWVLAGVKIEKDGGGSSLESMFNPSTTLDVWQEFNMTMPITEAGTYKFLCVVMGGELGTSTASVYYDGIQLFKQDDIPGYVNKILGDNNTSDADFLQENYPTVPIDLDVYTSTGFPKELNDSWNATQRFCMALDTEQASRDLVCSLDAAWSAEEGTLTVALEKLNGATWQSCGQADVSSAQITTVTVAAAMLDVGNNDFRFRTVSANDGTDSVTWDQVRFESAGWEHPVYDITLSVIYEGYSGGEAYTSEADVYADAFMVLGSTAQVGQPEDIMDVLCAEAAAIAMNPAEPIPEVKYPKNGAYGFPGYDGEKPEDAVLNYPGYVEAPVMGWAFRPFTNMEPIVVTNEISLHEDSTNGSAYIEFDSYQYIAVQSHTLRGAELVHNTNDPHFKLGERDGLSEEFGDGPFADEHTYVVGTPLENFPRRLVSRGGQGWPVKLNIVYEEDFREHSLAWNKYYIVASVLTNGAESNTKILRVRLKNALAELPEKELDVEVQDIHMGWATDEESWGKVDYPNLTYQDRNMVHVRSANTYGLASAPGWYITQTQRASATIEPMTLYVLRNGAWVQQMYEEYFFLWPSAASGVRSIFDDDTKIRLDGPASYNVSYKMGHENGTNEFGEASYWQLFEARGCAYYRMTDYHGVMAGSLRPMAANVFGLYGREETFLMPNSYTRVVPRTTPTNEPDDSYAEVYSTVRSRTNQAYIGAVKTAFHMSVDEVATNGAYFDVEMQTWANRDVEIEEEGPLCLFAQASMHWRGDLDYEINDFDEAHDIDTVMVHKPNGEWITHQMLNPPTGIYHRALCDYELGDVIYLQQQDRGLYSYGYVPEAPYQQASSFEFTLLEAPDRAISVDIYECCTAGEYADNVDITCNLKEGLEQGESLQYSYRYRTVFSPGVTIRRPNDTWGGDNWNTDGTYRIEFFATDALKTQLYANIYYGNGRDDDWSLINTEGIIDVPMDTHTVTYNWDVSSVPPGAYYIKAVAQTGSIARVGIDVSNSRLQVGDVIGLPQNVPTEQQEIVTGEPYQGHDLGFESGNMDDWETAATNWHVYSDFLALSVTNERACEGDYSLLMSGDWSGWGWNSAWQEIPCEEDEWLQVSGKIYIEQMDSAVGGWVVCGVKMESVNPVGKTESSAEFNESAATGEWLSFSFSRLAPVTGTDKLMPYVCGDDTAAVTVYFDDIQVVSTNNGTITVVDVQPAYWCGESGLDVSDGSTLVFTAGSTSDVNELDFWLSDINGVTNRVRITNYVDRLLSAESRLHIPLADFASVDLTQLAAMGYEPNRSDLIDLSVSEMQVRNDPLVISCSITGHPAVDFEGTPLFNRGETVTNIITISNVSGQDCDDIYIQAVQEYAQMKLWENIPDGHGEPHWGPAMRVGDRLNGEFEQVWTNITIPSGGSVTLTNCYTVPLGKHVYEETDEGEEFLNYYVFINYASLAQMHLVVRENDGDNLFASSQAAVYAMDDDYDIDDDGMTDDWETLYFGERTAALPDDDPDGDNFTNLEEFEAGSDPTDPLSVPADALQLTIAGSPDELGAPTPHGYGEHTLASNDTVEISVTSPVQYGDELYTCRGWVLEGLESSTGAELAVEFELLTNTVLTWLWDASYELKESALLYRGDPAIIQGGETGVVRQETAWGLFGCSVAADGGYAAVGVNGADSAYIYRRDGESWVLDERIEGSDTAFGDRLAAVDILGPILVAGCWEDDDNGSESGSAYIFERTGTDWDEAEKLNGSDTVAADRFGWDVSLDGDALLVGAPGPYHGSHAGCAYVFRNDGSWTEEAKLSAGSGVSYNEFGAAVDLEGDVALVGAHGQSVNAQTNVGMVCLFQYTNTTWQETVVFTNPSPAEGDCFGYAVAVQDDFVFIGEPGDDTRAEEAGLVHVYAQRGRGWIPVDTLYVDLSPAGAAFGASLTVRDDILLVGAPGEQDEGRVHVFRRVGRKWHRIASVAADNAASGDRYGAAVAMDRYSMLVGAPLADGVGAIYSRRTCETVPLADNWVVAGETTNTLTAPEAYTNADDLVFSFAGWELDGVPTNANPLTGVLMTAPRNADAVYTCPAEYLEIVLGQGDGEFNEFLDTGYPNDSLDLDQATVGAFPAELNDSWWQTQMFHFAVNQDHHDKSLVVHLCPAWNSGTSHLAVAMEYWNGDYWQRAGRADVNNETEADIVIPASRLREGSNAFRLVTADWFEDTIAHKWDQIYIESDGYPEGVLVVIGSNDTTDAEFLSSGFPTDPLDLDTVTAAGFPKELNDYGHDTQEFYLTLTADEAAYDLTFWLDTCWSDGSGALDVVLEIEKGTVWEPVKTVILSGSQDAQITVYAEDLVEGQNDFRLRRTGAVGDTHVVTWDQLIVEKGCQHTPALIALGVADSHDGEFLPSGFPGFSLNLDCISAAEFPKELNDNWWSNQYFHVSLTEAEAARSLVVTMNPYWSESNATMTVALDRRDRDQWMTVNEVELCDNVDGHVVIDPDALHVGRNDFRLRALLGAGATHALTWDQLMVASKTLWQSDADGDGICDAWEIQFGMDMENDDSAADPDHDGADNLHERIAGTNPLEEDSFLGCMALSEGDDYLLYWPGAQDRVYDVYRGTNMNGTFTRIVSDLPADLPLTSVSVSQGDDPTEIFRIRARTLNYEE